MSKNDMDDAKGLGWISFAGFMLMLGGLFHLLAGFVALFQETAVYNSSTGALWLFDFNQWGWTHMLIGLLAIGAAVSLMSGNMYGRVVAVVVAMLSAVANMAFIPTYPFWSLLIIVIDIMVIHAVVVYGGKLKLE